ncbi:xanthine dehydrogenase family protein molybdopterin-binding subunit [Roseateles sp. SL47]|uniref:xanthine dehydrogenase family protein molybdopterin-binding subunit n=1 Tax=Roseateles sp. SL47 TaxID=2995138 RepID=UPI002271FCD9|nr:xanthine dehydrogenase family protein molybdopterin-binding subunit [Roseateles sp. SL47]WAC73378.1 xanthine dehydrogenase family protein molybdopterin-binding subunit [Roseateles sp. SL47]
MNDRSSLPDTGLDSLHTTDLADLAIESDQQPRADAGTGLVSIGTGLPRIDALAKVTGRARYAAEHPPEPGTAPLLHGWVVNTAVACGRITAIDASAALALPGVVTVLTHENRPKMRSLDLFYKDMTAPAGSPFKPLHDDHIHYSGQPVALVVATSLELARHAARLVQVRVEAAPHETSLLAHRDRSHVPSSLKAGYSPPPKPRGDADVAWESASVRVDTESYAGVEHHNPMEMHATTVLVGKDGHLTVYDKTQGSQNSRWVISRVFGLPARKVTVRNPFVGGAFGSGLRPQYQLLLATMAALHLKQSVRVVLTRQQMFTFGHRPETWQRVRLASDHHGRLTAVIHEALAETSRKEDYVEVVVNWSGQLYHCDNVRLDYRLVALDQYSPIDMRAPGAAHGVHALEVAMDELAHATGLDPLDLRLRNYAERDSARDLPFSTKALRECYAQGAERFGWSRRAPRPRARREGDEWVGWGMATGTWDAMQMFARARATLRANGELVVESAASDIGTGTYTVMAQIAAAAMGLPMEQVSFRLGDSTLPVAPIEGGSSHVTTVGSAVEGACEKIQLELWKRARQHVDGFAKTRFEEVSFSDGHLRLKSGPQAIPYAQLVQVNGDQAIEARYLLLPNLLKQKNYVRAVHSAVFCEVRVDEELGTVRVTRVVSAVAAGRIINPVTARSQVVGGVVWGISQALLEETLSDHALGRFMNHNLSEYHVAANADVGEIDVLFVEEDDRIVSRLGAKGVGEIGIVGVAAAISNAIFHATGRRLRSTPMTPDKVMRRD